jgi:citrate lyase subunit beta/citryl-CoA lyase
VLFVPGDRPDRVAKAAQRGADAVAVDLEDAVAPATKEQARQLTFEYLRGARPSRTTVRVNSWDSGELEHDIERLAEVLPAVDAVFLPKASGADQVARFARLLGRSVGDSGPAVVPIVETAVGVFEARAIASASPRVRTLLFGVADLAADLGVRPTADGGELAFARAQVVLAAAAAGLAAPIDGPYLVLGDDDGLARSAAAARELGYGGKAVIHPDQIEPVHAAFAPRPAEIAWAEEVLAAAADGGAARLADGSFVDQPIVRRARHVLATVRADGAP